MSRGSKIAFLVFLLLFLSFCLAWMVPALFSQMPKSFIAGVIRPGQIMIRWGKYRSLSEKLPDRNGEFSGRGSDLALGDPSKSPTAKGDAWEERLTDEVRQAACKVARKRGLGLVITDLGWEFGGADITSDVLRELDRVRK
ncbi:MAG: hypothetical protein HYU64_00760 [Armatimonadetes bacterium]|nr:hypothetical protein [Armatimonadota bacterium]